MTNMKYVFIDESGDLGIRGTDYFVMAMIVVDNEKPLRRIVKKTRQIKLKKNERDITELKANKNRDEVREYLLKKIASLDGEIYAIVVRKAKMMSHFYEIKDIFYNFVSRILLSETEVGNDNIKLYVVIDKKYNNTIIRRKFNGYVKRETESRNAGVKIEKIIHGDSEAYTGLQCVDFVAWAISRKFNYSDDRFYKIIENKIVNKDRMILWE